MAKPKLPNLNSLMPPIDHVCIEGFLKKVWFVRLDLLPYGGGNKVIRIMAWLKKRHWPDHIFAMSDAGSNTFLTLLNLMESEEFGIEQLTLLSRGEPVGDYAKTIQSRLLKHPKIMVINNVTFVLWLRLLFLKLTHKAVLPIGGGTNAGAVLDQAVFEKVQANISSQSDTAGSIFIHTLPVASGSLLMAFSLGASKIQGQTNDQNRLLLKGIYTGTAPGLFYYWKKLRFIGRADLQKSSITAQSNSVKLKVNSPACEFLSLDPVHMLPSFLCLQNSLGAPSKKTDSYSQVVWVTSPKKPF